MKFIDQSYGFESLSKEQRSEDQPVPIVREKPRRIALLKSITPDEDSIAVGFFLTSIVSLGRSFDSSQGFLEPLYPIIAREGPSSLLNTVLTAVSTKIWSMWTNPSRAFHTPHVPFTKALRRLQSALNNPSETSRDVTVLSIILMHFYESIASRAMRQPTLRAHQDGARALLEHEADSVHDWDCRGYVKTYLRHCDVSTYLEFQPADTSSLDIWRETGREDSMPASPNAALDLIGLELSSLQERLAKTQSLLSTDSSCIYELDTWWQDLRRAEEKLSDWENVVPGSWRPFTRVVDKDMSLSGLCDLYLTVQIATIWNVWRICRLLVVQMKLSFRLGIPPHTLEQITTMSADGDMSSELQTGKELVDAMCRSLPFYIGNRQTNSGIHDMEDPKIIIPSYHDEDLDQKIRITYRDSDRSMSLQDYRLHILVQGPTHALLHLNSLTKVLDSDSGQVLCQALGEEQVLWIRQQFQRVTSLVNPHA